MSEETPEASADLIESPESGTPEADSPVVEDDGSPAGDSPAEDLIPDPTDEGGETPGEDLEALKTRISDKDRYIRQLSEQAKAAAAQAAQAQQQVNFLMQQGALQRQQQPGQPQNPYGYEYGEDAPAQQQPQMPQQPRTDPIVATMAMNMLKSQGKEFLAKYPDCASPERIALIQNKLHRDYGFSLENVTQADLDGRYGRLLEDARAALFGNEVAKKNEIERKKREKAKQEKARQARISTASDSTIETAGGGGKKSYGEDFDPTKDDPGAYVSRFLAE